MNDSFVSENYGVFGADTFKLVCNRRLVAGNASPLAGGERAQFSDRQIGDVEKWRHRIGWESHSFADSGFPG
jgi:hypothetical protein